jgi:predicted protein tyrosine phosphatase
MAAKRERILFVCTANIDRSPTAENLYAGDPRYQVLSAGTAPFAIVPVTQQILQWADRIFVMCDREDHHKTDILQRFPELQLEIVDLDIEDRWYRGDPELVKRLLEKLVPHLGEPRARED